MRSKNDHKLSDLLGEFSQSRSLQRGLKKVSLRKFWQERMGDLINRYTGEIYVVKDTLVVHIESSPLRQQLSYETDRILELVHEEFGKEYITKVQLR